jgi:hypothetical protein
MAASSKKKKFVYGIAAGALFLFCLLQSGILILLGSHFSMEADVVSVASSSRGQLEAAVRLPWGPVVRAAVPAACLVSSGQIGKVTFTGPLIGSEPAFQLWESRDK